MKKSILLVFILSLNTSFAQIEKSFKINWSDLKKSSLEISDNQYVYSNKIVLSDNLKVIKCELRNVKFDDARTVKKSILAEDSIDFKFKSTFARDDNFLVFSFNPYVKNNNSNKKIISFDVYYETEFIQDLNRSYAQSSSVLATGDWFKFKVSKSGVHKLDRNFIRSLGVDTDDLDPNKIRIFGYGGEMLPLLNQDNLYYDLPEIPIKVVGDSDGQFNNEDYVLFYATGNDNWNKESETNLNLYTTETFYYLNISSANGKRITDYNEPSGPIDKTLNTFLERQHHERDIENLSTLGRRWLGERFSLESNRTFSFQFDRIVNTEPIKVEINTASKSELVSSFDIYLNGNLKTSLSYNTSTASIYGFGRYYETSDLVSGSNIEIGMIYNNQGNPNAVGYLDFINIYATCKLETDGKQFTFNSEINPSPEIHQYNITNTTNIKEIWQVDDLYNVSSINNNSTLITFNGISNSISKKYVVLEENDYYFPTKADNPKVNNQNLKKSIFTDNNGNLTDIEYIIITPNYLKSQAQSLADLYSIERNVNSKAITLEEIYAEFSTGNQDVAAIRNFIKYVYDNPIDSSKRLKYVNMFGDGSYDNQDRIPNNTNIVPTYNYLKTTIYDASGNAIFSPVQYLSAKMFSSDDFYVLLDANEGYAEQNELIDVAVGRMLVTSPNQAQEMVNKIKRYYQKESFAKWRNNLTFISDDVDHDWEEVLQANVDDLANRIELEKPFFNIKKIHSDAFLQESSSSGQSYPDVNKVITDSFEDGTLFAVYFGHGGPDGLAGEKIFNKDMSVNFRNDCKFPLVMTVTCEFARFDNPFKKTVGEYLYQNEKGGAIGLISTTRKIGPSDGVNFNETFSEELFAYGSNEYVSVGEALMNAKNLVSSNFKRIIYYFGDPALMLAIPKTEVVLTKINNLDITSSTPTLNGLGKYTIEGEVRNESGSLLSNYNGEISTSIFDKKIDRQTLANDNTTNTSGLIKLDFNTLGEIIFRGKASVTNGVFSFEFIVPKDIQTNIDKGRFNFYTKKTNELIDYTGSNLDVNIGGIDVNAPEDNTPPEIDLFLNDETFVNGSISSTNPLLLVDLFDESGINTLGGIGHDIKMTLDQNTENAKILNEFYETDLDDYKNGSVKYQIRDLETGLHTLTVKAWDVYNNSSETTIEFEVKDENEELILNNVLNYPNPMISHTEFWFNHNSSSLLDIKIEIFTVSGKIIKTIFGQTQISDLNKTYSSLSRDVIWDGLDDFGNKIGKGTYVYKLTVRSPDSGKSKSAFQKLVILQ